MAMHGVCSACALRPNSAARTALKTLLPTHTLSLGGPLHWHVQKVDCDRQRQELREGLTALKKSSQRTVWLMRPGGVMLKADADKARAIIEQGGQSCMQSCGCMAGGRCMVRLAGRRHAESGC